MSFFSLKSSSFSLRSSRIFTQLQQQPWQFRKGALPSERWPIFRALLQEKLNFLGVLHTDRFTVATSSTSDDGGSVVAGFGQIKPIDDNKLELSSIFVKPELRYI